jgi:glycosyltransferase involved in cell wall biosynthesis
MPELVGGVHKRLYAKFMYGAVARKASQIMCDSNFTWAEFIRLCGVPRGGIHPVYLGVDIDWHNVVKNDNPSDTPYILYSGNVKPHKNLSRLIEAFSLLTEKIPHKLVIVGKKEGFITSDDSVSEVASKLGNRVLFTGFISDDLLKQYYGHASMLVLPSLYEGFGLPPLEAMACGCPTIVSDVASLPEVCGEGSLYFNPYDVNDIADKLFLLLSSPELQEKLRINGYKQVGKFTWLKCVKETLSVIEKALIP